MKKLAAVILIMLCFLSGCGLKNTAEDIDVGDIHVGDIDQGKIDIGIYIKAEPNDIYSVDWKYDNQSGTYSEASGAALPQDIFMLLTTDISNMARNEDRAIDFTVVARKKNGKVFAKKEFSYEPEVRRMELTITKDGTIRG